jgi:integrase/recombinase XerC
MQRWDRLVDRYIDQYRARGVSAERVLQVQRELERWGAWMKRRRPRLTLEAVDAESLVEYIRQRNKFRARATLSTNISTMRCMGEFLVRERIWPSNPLRWIRGPKMDPRCHLPRRLDLSALKQLWATAATSRETYLRYLWITVLSVFYGTGIRRGELSRLDLAAWDGEQGVLRIDGRKTGVQRIVPVPPLVRQCMDSYLPQRHNQLERTRRLEESALFVNKKGSRLSYAGVSRAIHRIARRAKVPFLSLQQFRHTCASDLLEEGLSLPEVQAVLGHQAISTTVRYLHIADPQKHEAIRRHPINEWMRHKEASA